jgi:glycosyltransferase involved in cell wall biosynthesis
MPEWVTGSRSGGESTENRTSTKRESAESVERVGLRACMVAYTFYENDNRVRRYAETLRKHGAEVDVIALCREGLPYHSVIEGVNVYRIQKRSIDEKGKFSYLYRLMKFLVRSSVKLEQMHLRKRYDVVHVHNVPDFEVFAAIIPKLTGAKIILDIHDILPEFYGSKFNKDDRSLSYKMVLLIEKLSAAFADHVIISNDLWVKYYTERAIDKDRCTVILNYPDPRLFYYPPQGKKKDDGKTTLIYPGTLNWHQGVDIAIRAFAVIARKYPDVTFSVYGDGPTRVSLIQLVKDLGLEGRVILVGMVPIDEISGVMSRADIGVVPKRANSFGNEAFSTKTLEFMALGVPVIVSNTKIDKYYFSDDLVLFFENEDVEDLAVKMELMITNREIREQFIKKSFEYIQRNNWDVKKRIYLGLIYSLTGKKL